MTAPDKIDHDQAPETRKATQRVFFALWPDDATRETIDAFTREAVEECGGTPVSADNFHMTLRFIGLGCRKAPDPLLRLVVNLNTELGSEGFLVETRPFKPHVTLARHARHAPQAELREPVEWCSDRFVLVGSRSDDEGATYTVLDEWPLAGKRG